MPTQQALAINYPISDFLDWQASNQLEIVPWFQRRSVWTAKARSYFIDTILRAMPMPPLFIRLQVELPERRSFRQVVDGQQRIRAILEFVNDEFPVLNVHNPEYANMTFTDLPREAQHAFLAYKLPVYVLEGASDSEVLRIFARLNTYTIPLNKQELRNANYFGAFKQTVYDIAFQHLTFWRRNKILTDQKIARMDDAELVSELVVTVIEGFQTTKDKDLRQYYGKWDDDFPHSREIRERFERTIDAIGFVFDGRLASGPYKRAPLFFSLFCLFYDAMFGLPEFDSPKLKLSTRAEAKRIYEALDRLGQKIQAKETPRGLLRLVDASRRATSDPGRRRLRHKHLWQVVRQALEV